MHDGKLKLCAGAPAQPPSEATRGSVPPATETAAPDSGTVATPNDAVTFAKSMLAAVGAAVLALAM
jgi:hypothetical protein